MSWPIVIEIPLLLKNLLHGVSHVAHNFLGAEYLVSVSSRSLKMREKYANWDNLWAFHPIFIVFGDQVTKILLIGLFTFFTETRQAKKEQMEMKI